MLIGPGGIMIPALVIYVAASFRIEIHIFHKSLVFTNFIPSLSSFSLAVIHSEGHEILEIPLNDMNNCMVKKWV